jgi:hypothetical protein
MKRTLVWSTSLLLMVCATAAVADDSKLKGDYGVTGTGVCNVNGVSVGLFTFNGTRTFHSDGTGTSSFISHSINAGTLGPETDSAVVDAFSYALNGDGSWTRAIDPGSWKGTILNGPRAGMTFSIDQLPKSTGFVSDAAGTLTEVTNELVLETSTFSDGIVTHRVCQRSFVLIKRLP